MKKIKLLLLLLTAPLVLAGCSGSSGTAFDINAKADIGTPEFADFCANRGNLGIAVNTVGFATDILMPQGLQAVAGLFRGDEGNLLNNPTTQAINEKCDEQLSLEGESK